MERIYQALGLQQKLQRVWIKVAIKASVFIMKGIKTLVERPPKNRFVSKFVYNKVDSFGNVSFDGSTYTS